MKPTFALLLLVGAAGADDAALRHCRGMADAVARLACYDALPLAPLAPTLSPPPGKTAAAVPAAATSPAPPAPPALSTSPATASTFGLRSPDHADEEIVSRIPGLFEGWGPGERIRLANGQLWQVSDDSRGVYYLREPKVTVRRAAMATFVLDIEGAARMPRVRRLE